MERVAVLDLLPGPSQRHNLPAQLTSFVGRERALAELGRSLSGTRLLTLTGAPGVGKTRLALQLASEALETYPDGVWLIELAPLADPELVPQAVAAVFGVREQPGRAIVDTLAEALREQQLLVLLDNCEHVVEACAVLADRLLRACRRVEIVATSREALGIAGETSWQVPSLDMPAEAAPSAGERLAALGEAGAVRLFVERARAAVPAFTLSDRNARAVVQVCRRLDGVPLALELAAARIRVLTAEQLAARLDEAIAVQGHMRTDDRFRLLTAGRRAALPRQQTLRAAVEWSYQLLSEPERVLLRRLAVFAGGWTLEAAEEVCGGHGVASEDVLELLAELVNKSLVLAEESSAGGAARYRMLEMIRQYAWERLREAGDGAATARRHLEWVRVLAEEAEPHLRGRDDDAWLGRLGQEIDNLRAALTWSQREQVGAESGLRIVGAAWQFWYLRGRISEGRRWSDGALMAGDGPPAVRAPALLAACSFAHVQGDDERAEAAAEEGLAAYRQLGDTRGIGIACFALGRIAQRRGDRERSRTLTEESLEMCLAAGEQRYAAMSFGGLGMLAHEQGDYERAAAYYQAGLARYRELEDRYGIGWSLHYQGLAACAQGELTRARSLLEAGLRLRHEIGDLEGVAGSLEGLAAVAVAQDELSRAVRLLAAAEACREAVGTPVPLNECLEYERLQMMARADLGEDAFAATWAAGRALSLDDAIEEALGQMEPEPAPAAPAARPGGTRSAGPLSLREQEVAVLIAQGQTNRHIAGQLVISEWTVDTHVRHILTKLDFRSRAQVAAWVTEQGLAPPNVG
jgi:predicted ATPase/DNA-binding CsgD family transcriptional regulator